MVVLSELVPCKDQNYIAKTVTTVMNGCQLSSHSSQRTVPCRIDYAVTFTWLCSTSSLTFSMFESFNFNLNDGRPETPYHMIVYSFFKIFVLKIDHFDLIL